MALSYSPHADINGLRLDKNPIGLYTYLCLVHEGRF